LKNRKRIERQRDLVWKLYLWASKIKKRAAAEREKLMQMVEEGDNDG